MNNIVWFCKDEIYILPVCLSFELQSSFSEVV